MRASWGGLGDEALPAGWVHYLAFDPFIGGWIAAEADKLGMARPVQARSHSRAPLRLFH